MKRVGSRHSCVVLGLWTLVAAIAALLALGAPAGAASNVLVPYLDTGWKYQVVPYDDGQGFEQPGFDDSGFSTGTAGFARCFVKG